MGKAEKAAQRARMQALEAALPEAYIAESDAGIFENLCRLPEMQAAKTVFVYYSIGREADTRRLIAWLLETGRTPALPVCLPGRLMELRALAGLDDLIPGKFGIPVPAEGSRLVLPQETELAVIPAAALTASGMRLGRGGGYYDRFLAEYAGFPVGITRQRLLQKTVPVEAFDRTLPCVVTETAVYRPR